jgi:predicted transcriptional regulator
MQGIVVLMVNNTAAEDTALAFVSARLPASERERLDEVAAATDRTPSAIVRRALRLYMNHPEEAERLLSTSSAAA